MLPGRASRPIRCHELLHAALYFLSHRFRFRIRSCHFHVYAWRTGKDFGVEQPARFGVLKEARKERM